MRCLHGADKQILENRDILESYGTNIALIRPFAADVYIYEGSGGLAAGLLEAHELSRRTFLKEKLDKIFERMQASIRSWLEEGHRVRPSSLPMAENASTFAEMLLVDRLLEIETDPAVRRDILFSQVDDAYATIMRQIFFAMFEGGARVRSG